MSGDTANVPVDWQVNKSLLDCASRLYLSSHLSDVTFLFLDEEPRVSLHAHKFILALRSPVFETMFYGALPARDTVEIVDNTSSSFKALLKFVYTDRTEFNTCATVIETMQAAHKYRIPLLAELCADHLETSVTVDMVCSVLDQAVLYDFKKLQTHCQKFIDEQAFYVFQTEGFLMISVHSLELILQSDNLSLEEHDVYQATVLWAEAECKRQELPASGENKRKVLGTAFYHLRIPNIPLDTFASCVSRDGLLSELEVIDLFRRYTSEPELGIDFVNCQKRNRTCLVISRMQDGLRKNHVNKGWRSETIKFCTDHNARLLSLGLLNTIIRTDYGDELLGNRHMMAMELHELHTDYTDSESEDDEEFLNRRRRSGNMNKSSGVTGFTSTFSSETKNHISADLPKPIDLLADQWYRLEVTLYSFNSSVSKGKSYLQLFGSAIKTKVTHSSGIKVLFQGSTHGPIHSLYLWARKTQASN